MTKAVILRENSNLYRYLVYNQEEKTIYCITDNEHSAAAESEIEKKIAFNKNDFQLKMVTDLSLEEELFLIWPQIIKNFEVYFSFSNNWLKRAQLFLEDQELKIKVETKMAQKKLAQPKVIIIQ